MFEWFDMIGTYEQRKVANFKCDEFEIDTAYVTDRNVHYETAIAHKNFNDGDWITLGWNETKEEARKAHDEWVKYFKEDKCERIIDAWTGAEYRR